MIPNENLLNNAHEAELKPYGKVKILFQVGIENKKLKATRIIIIALISDSSWVAGWCANSPEKLDETWYNGESWEDLLASYRVGLAENLRQGFVPEGQTPGIK